MKSQFCSVRVFKKCGDAEGEVARRSTNRRKSLLPMVIGLAIGVCGFGCGGGGSPVPPPVPQPATIAFASGRALNGSDAANTNFTRNIWTVKSDGSGATPLTKITANGGDSASPVWSPGGSKLAFASRRALDGSDAANTNTTFNIWTVQADGSGATPLTRLTANGGDSSSPVWSPDGSKLAFASSRALDGSDARNTNDTANIWVVQADGSGATPLTRLTATGGDSTSPAWHP
jgi:Tol biopolymer transport system component